MGEKNTSVGQSICLAPKKQNTTFANVEKINNGYIVFPNTNYGQEQKKIFVTELSEVPAVLANIFGLHDNIDNS